jgi:hypothetical protein
MNYPDGLAWGLGCAMLTVCAGTGFLYILCQCAEIIVRVLDKLTEVFNDIRVKKVG